MKTLGRSLIVGSVVIAAACGHEDAAQAQGNRGQVQQPLGNAPAVIDTTLAARLSATFRGAAERALPAVVYIQVQSRTVARSTPSIPGFPPGFFGPPESRPQVELASGSGFIYDPSGLILTNNHVVANATQVLVQMQNGQEYPAEIVGRDPTTDVAVIRIHPKDGERLPAVQIGNSDAAQVGDWVLALGNPFTLTFSVTAGIISAKGRNIPIIQQSLPQQQQQMALEAFIQTDAAINPGNSGGPLVDLNGRVIGINSAIESETGSFAGAGFAIPINLAMRVAGDLVRYGAVHRPRLGIVVQSVGAADAQVYGLPAVAGALVAGVQAGTPAAEAGLRVGDVITAVDGRPVRTQTDLTTMLAEMHPGDVVTLTYYRDRQPHTARVKLGEFSATGAGPTAGPSRPSSQERLGLTIQPLTPDIARQLGISRTSGVVISDVSPLSPAAGRVTRGEVILSINGQPINTVGDVERIASALKPGQVVSMQLLNPDPNIGQTVANFIIR